MLDNNDREPCMLPFIVNETDFRIDACNGWINTYSTPCCKISAEGRVKEKLVAPGRHC